MTMRGNKRPLSKMWQDKDESKKKQKLRDKNRTNSKRFRDRKKSYMNVLFEEKYRLGMENNELKEQHQKLKAMLEEALKENELFRRNRTSLAPTLGPSIGQEIPAEVQCRFGLASKYPIHSGSKLSGAPQPRAPIFLPTRVEDCVALSSVSPHVSLVGALQIKVQQDLLTRLAL